MNSYWDFYFNDPLNGISHGKLSKHSPQSSEAVDPSNSVVWGTVTPGVWDTEMVMKTYNKIYSFYLIFSFSLEL